MRALECHSGICILFGVGNICSFNKYLVFQEINIHSRNIYIYTYSWPGPGDRAVCETDKNVCPAGADILVEKQLINTKMNKR